jgi:hypothetical protein
MSARARHKVPANQDRTVPEPAFHELLRGFYERFWCVVPPQNGQLAGVDTL